MRIYFEDGVGFYEVPGEGSFSSLDEVRDTYIRNCAFCSVFDNDDND